MSYTESVPRGTTIFNTIQATTDGKLTPLRDKKQKKETDTKMQAPDDLVHQRGKAPDKNGKIVAQTPDGAGYTPPARPAIAVKTPSFKAPKQLGTRKPPIIAGGPGSGRKPDFKSTDSRSKTVLNNMHSDLKDKGFKYKNSSAGPNKGQLVHTYESPSGGKSGGGQAHITENANGNHKAVYDSGLSNFPVNLPGRL
jgi:hypothetical protein